MDTALARNIAHETHVGQLDRFGEPVIEHVARVAAAVPAEAEAAAWLHEVLERSDAKPDRLRCLGLSKVELDALELLTRTPAECYELYALRIAHAPGHAGVLARTVKLADLEDHLRHPALPAAAPPYGWARRRIVAAQGADCRLRRRGVASRP